MPAEQVCPFGPPHTFTGSYSDHLASHPIARPPRRGLRNYGVCGCGEPATRWDALCDACRARLVAKQPGEVLG